MPAVSERSNSKKRNKELTFLTIAYRCFLLYIYIVQCSILLHRHPSCRLCGRCGQQSAHRSARKGRYGRHESFSAALVGAHPKMATKRPVAISAGLSLFKNGAHLASFEILCIFHFWNKEKAPLMVPSFLPFLPSPLTPIYSIFSFSPLLSPQKKVCKNARA